VRPSTTSDGGEKAGLTIHHAKSGRQRWSLRQGREPHGRQCIRILSGDSRRKVQVRRDAGGGRRLRRGRGVQGLEALRRGLRGALPAVRPYASEWRGWEGESPRQSERQTVSFEAFLSLRLCTFDRASSRGSPACSSPSNSSSPTSSGSIVRSAITSWRSIS
jgi:hypothetical protein